MISSSSFFFVCTYTKGSSMEISVTDIKGVITTLVGVTSVRCVSDTWTERGNTEEYALIMEKQDSGAGLQVHIDTGEHRLELCRR